MLEPVLLVGDCMTYERADIIRWLVKNGTSPVTGVLAWL